MSMIFEKQSDTKLEHDHENDGIKTNHNGSTSIIQL